MQQKAVKLKFMYVSYYSNHTTRTKSISQFSAVNTQILGHTAQPTRRVTGHLPDVLGFNPSSITYSHSLIHRGQRGRTKRERERERVQESREEKRREETFLGRGNKGLQAELTCRTR